MANVQKSSDTAMSIGDHIEELRIRIIWSIIPPLPLAILFFFLADTIVRWFLIPLHIVLEDHGLPTQVQVLSPPEFLLAEMKIALGAAILAAGPWILIQLWKFVSPGLHIHERRFVYFLIPLSTLLGAGGLLLMYFFMLPVILDFMVSLAGHVEVTVQTVTIGESISSVSYPLLEAQPTIAAAGDAWVKLPEGVLHIAIPTTDGTLPERPLQLLSFCDKGDSVSIARIGNQNANFLQFAQDNGLLLGARIEVTNRNDIADSMTIHAKGKEVVLGLAAAGRIEVEYA